MPDIKEASGEGAANDGKSSDALERAMKDAVEAVEKVESQSKGPDVEIDDEDEGGEEVEVAAGGEEAEPSESKANDKAEKKDAGQAVTEALLKAKNELEDALKQTREETKRFREKWLRAAADLENYKKRSARERDDIVKFANERLLKDFLPVLDDLDRTIEVMSTQEGGEALLDGVKMVRKKFLTQLEKHGVTTFESLGETFDPGQHEAVQQLHSDEVPAGGVAAELRRGFFISGRLLRPAMVAVSLGAASGKAKEGEGQADGESAADEGSGE